MRVREYYWQDEAVDAGAFLMADFFYHRPDDVVETDYAQPDVRCDLPHGAGNDPYDGPMDRFGRVIDLLWYDYGSSTDVLRIKHGYDHAGTPSGQKSQPMRKPRSE